MTTNPGDVLRVYTDPPFTDADGTAADPTVVTLRWHYANEEATEWVAGTDAEIVADATGTYYADIPLTRPGRLYYTWVGEGDVAAVQGGSEMVYPAPGDSWSPVLDDH